MVVLKPSCRVSLLKRYSVRKEWRTGYVLGEKLCANLLALLAAVGVRVPENGYEVVCVVSRSDFHVLDCRGTDMRAVGQDVDVKVRYCSGVFRRIRKVNHRRNGKTRGRSVRYRHIANLDVDRTRNVLITVTGLATMSNRWTPKVSTCRTQGHTLDHELVTNV